MRAGPPAGRNLGRATRVDLPAEQARQGNGVRHARLPTALVVWLVVVPAIFTVVLGFARWEGIGGLDTIEWLG